MECQVIFQRSPGKEGDGASSTPSNAGATSTARGRSRAAAAPLTCDANFTYGIPTVNGRAALRLICCDRLFLAAQGASKNAKRNEQPGGILKVECSINIEADLHHHSDLS